MFFLHFGVIWLCAWIKLDAWGNKAGVNAQFSLDETVLAFPPRPEYDVIGVVFPIYRLSMPAMISRFLEKVQIKADYTFAIDTYGNLPGAAMRNVQKQAKKNGYRFDYANDLLMLDNYLPVFEIDSQVEKIPKKRIEENTIKIVEDIKLRKHREAAASPIFRAITALLGIAPPNGKIAQNYIVNKQCNKCGICTQVCPAQNIDVTDKVNFNIRCEECLACLHLCPKNAIHLKNERSEKRWRNPDVSLKEIVKSNNRKK